MHPPASTKNAGFYALNAGLAQRIDHGAHCAGEAGMLCLEPHRSAFQRFCGWLRWGIRDGRILGQRASYVVERAFEQQTVVRVETARRAESVVQFEQGLLQVAHVASSSSYRWPSLAVVSARRPAENTPQGKKPKMLVAAFRVLAAGGDVP